MKEKLALLERTPEPAINQAAKTILDLSAIWENITQDERKDLAHVMIQEVGVDKAAKCMLWVRARPDYEPLFSFLDGLRVCIRHSFWMSEQSIEVNTCDMREDMRHIMTEVKIALPMPHNILTRAEEHVK